MTKKKSKEVKPSKPAKPETKKTDPVKTQSAVLPGEQAWLRGESVKCAPNESE